MEIPRHWRLKKQRYALVGEICPHCQGKIFPPRDVCPHCGGEAREPYAFSGHGKVYSYTVVADPPAGFERNAPYAVALVQLDEGPDGDRAADRPGRTKGGDRHAGGDGHPPHPFGWG